MGFGLHVGWAIEGTIGSKFKIDASYLSPNVNVSARLEAATHMYDCPLLFSGFFADELSPAARSFCRMVDVVSVKGSNVPLELWTFDISTYPGKFTSTLYHGVEWPQGPEGRGLFLRYVFIETSSATSRRSLCRVSTMEFDTCSMAWRLALVEEEPSSEARSKSCRWMDEDL